MPGVVNNVLRFISVTLVLPCLLGSQSERDINTLCCFANSPQFELHAYTVDDVFLPGNHVVDEDVDFDYVAVDVDGDRGYGCGIRYNDKDEAVKVQSILRFQEGTTYVVEETKNKSHCVKYHQHFPKFFCIPSDARKGPDVRVGAPGHSIKAQTYRGQLRWYSSSVVDGDYLWALSENCVPVFHGGTALTPDGKISYNAAFPANFNSTVKDPSVFAIPDICKNATEVTDYPWKIPMFFV